MLTPQNYRKNGFSMGVLWYIYPSDTQEYSKNAFLVSYGPYMKKFRTFSISRELCIKINWFTFQNDRNTIFLSVFNKIYTSRTKGNGLKWEFQAFFWMRISEFLSKLYSLYRIVRVSFCKNFNLDISSYATGLEPTTTYFVNEHSTFWPNWITEGGFTLKRVRDMIRTYSQYLRVLLNFKHFTKIYIRGCGKFF